jgi:competence protein ComEC
MNKYLPLFTAVFISGIIFTSRLRISFEVFFISGILILLAGIIAGGRARAFLYLTYLTAFILGALLMKISYILPADHIARLLAYGKQNICSVEGYIVNQPSIKNGRTTFFFSARQMQQDKYRYKCSGRILVTLDFTADLNYGEGLLLTGSLRRLKQYARPRSGYAEYLSRQSVYLSLKVNSSLGLSRLKINRGFWLKVFSLRLREFLEGKIARYSAPLPAAVISAMVLGEKKGLPQLVNRVMTNSGTVHILVVSGFNVGVVAFLSDLIFKIARLKRRKRIILVTVSILLYCLVTGAAIPVVRATVMAVMLLFAYYLEREPQIYNALSLAAIFILSLNPRQLFDIGFQLSFASVWAIAWGYPKLKTLFRVQSIKPGLCGFLLEGFLVSLSAWLGTAGIIAYNFRIFSPISVFLNILIVPLATLITLAGFSIVLAGVFCPGAASLFASSADFLVTILLRLNLAAVKIPFSYIYF